MLCCVGVAGTQNINLVKQYIEQQGSLPVCSLKSFLIGPSCVGKTSARRRLTGEIKHISPNKIIPSTGIDAPLTVRLHHPTEQSSVLLSQGWHSQGLEEQCRALCSYVINTPTQPSEPSSNRSAAAESAITASPVAASHWTTPLSKLTYLFKQVISRRSQATPATVKVASMAAQNEATTTHDEATAAQDELTTSLTTLVKAGDWKSIRDFLKEVQTLTFLHIVDIGGQPEFHEILPLLLHGLALNLIFLNTTQDLDSPYTVVYRDGSGNDSLQYKSESTVREVIQRALCTISSLQSSESHKPAAILIGTYCDLTSEADVLALDQSIQESFMEANFMKKDVLCAVNKPGEERRYIYPLDNISGDPSEIDGLRQLISNIVHDRFTPVMVPTAALLLHLILRMKFDRSPGWCTLEQCIQVAESCGVSKEDLLREDGILQYLHDNFGTILYYRKLTKLSLRVIINTNVIMGPPSKLFLIAFGALKTEQQTAEHIRATGEISHRLMSKVCSSNTDDTEQSDNDIPTDEIVELLKARYILFENARSVDDEVVYFMPALLYPDHNVAKESSDPDLHASLPYPSMLFLPSIGDVPLGQFPATTVNLSKHWRPDEKHRFRNRIRFYAKCKNEEVLHVELCALSTHIEFRVLPQPSIDTCLMVESLQKLWDVFTEVTSLYSHTRVVKWSVGFYCPHSLQSGCRPHPAVCTSVNNPTKMICSQRDCQGDLILLDDKHKSWFMVST